MIPLTLGLVKRGILDIWSKHSEGRPDIDIDNKCMKINFSATSQLKNDRPGDDGTLRSV